MEEWKKPAEPEERPEEAAGGAAKPEVSAEDDFIGRDYEDFTRRFPQTDPRELEDNGMFRRFCGSRYGRESLGDLYEAYLEIVSAVWEAARLSADDKRSRTTGSGGSGGADSRLTAAQQRALEEWNASNPSMKMTAKEFLSR